MSSYHPGAPLADYQSVGRARRDLTEVGLVPEAAREEVGVWSRSYNSLSS